MQKRRIPLAVIVLIIESPPHEMCYEGENELPRVEQPNGVYRPGDVSGRERRARSTSPYRYAIMSSQK